MPRTADNAGAATRQLLSLLAETPLSENWTCQMAEKTTAKNPSERFKRLISHGFFAPELPPCFHTLQLARKRATIWRQIEQVQLPNSGDYQKHLTETSWFHFPRFGRNDRRYGLLNPISFLAIAKVLSDNFVKLRADATKRSSISTSPLVFDWNGTRAILRPSIDLRDDFRIDLASRREKFVSVDLRAFYHSIYTHAIPWAIHGKAFAKRDRRPQHFGNLLDQLCRNAQGGQTLGLPVGPDTSRVIAEVVASAIDEELRSITKVTSRDASRYVDDYTISSPDGQSDQALIAAIRRAAAKFELELNHDKTAVVPTSAYLNSGWKQVALGHRPKSPYLKTDFQRFLYETTRLARELPNTNVEKWALQNARIAFLGADKDTWRGLQSYLVNAYRRNSTIISLLVELIIGRHIEHGDVDIASLRDFLDHRIPTLAIEDRTGELVWLLFLVASLKIEIRADSLEPVFKLEEPMCAILISLAKKWDCVAGSIESSVWQRSLSEAGLNGAMWLYSYEGSREGLIQGASLDHIRNHPYFQILNAENVGFLSVDKGVSAIVGGMVQRRADNAHRARIRESWADLSDIDDWDISDDEPVDDWGY
jgi:hypothetical protein